MDYLSYFTYFFLGKQKGNKEKFKPNHNQTFLEKICLQKKIFNQKLSKLNHQEDKNAIILLNKINNSILKFETNNIDKVGDYIDEISELNNDLLQLKHLIEYSKFYHPILETRFLEILDQIQEFENITF